MQRVDILQDVALSVRNEHHVQLIERLIHVAHIVLLDGRVLGSGVSQLGERGQQTFDSRARDLPELSREHGFAAPRADGGGENDLGTALAESTGSKGISRHGVRTILSARV